MNNLIRVLMQLCPDWESNRGPLDPGPTPTTVPSRCEVCLHVRKAVQVSHTSTETKRPLYNSTSERIQVITVVQVGSVVR